MTTGLVRGLLRPAGTGLWLGLLILPFRGPEAALIAAGAVFASVLAFRFSRVPARSLMKRIHDLSGKITGRFRLEGDRLLAILIPLLIIPLFSGGYVTDVAILAGIYVILALGLNVIVGFTGLLNLGFVAFYAIGAYSFALLSTGLGLGFWSAMPFSVLITTLAGFLLAIPALRLRGDYLAIVTLGFGEIVRLVLNNWDSLTRGPNGISGIAPAAILSFEISGLSHLYLFVLCFAGFSLFIVRRISNSMVGRAWMAIREDEIAAAAMGVSTMRYKLYSCAFGAFLAGMAGCLFSVKMRFVSPESFTFMESVFILCMVILGGLGSVAGVVVGALILVLLPEALREVQLYRMLALGAGLVLLMVFRPQGLFGGERASLGR